MPNRAYAGRHRGRHRAAVQPRPGRGVALPGAAAAVLTVTATGAVLVPGSAGATAQPEHTDRDGGVPAATAVGSTRHVADASADLRSAEIAEVAATVRAEARERASRAAERKAVAARKAKAAAAAHRWVLPVQKGAYRFSSPFGMRWGSLHPGDDFACPIGTEVVSIGTGTVVFAGQQSGYGNKVEIRHWDGTVSWYGHLSRILVRVGQDVDPGEQIAKSGNTGFSTGPHVHLEVHPAGGGPVDPRPWLAKRGLKI